MFMNWKAQHCKDGTFIQTDLQIPCNSSQKPQKVYFVEIEKLILTFIWKYQVAKIAKKMLKKNKLRGII